MPIAHLTEQAKALTDEVAGLTLAVEHLDRRTNRNEKVQAFVVFGLLLDLVLSVAVGLVVGNQIAAANDVKTAVEREQVTRNQGVCPIYALLLGSYNPNTRIEGPDRDAYIKIFQNIDASYRALECKQAPVPPRADQSATPVPR
jgi:hypothetical protein